MPAAALRALIRQAGEIDQQCGEPLSVGGIGLEGVGGVSLLKLELDQAASKLLKITARRLFSILSCSISRLS